MPRKRRFGLFTSLPPEIRIIIWTFALPRDVPELCFPQPAGILEFTSPTVYTNYPAIIHVCREARCLAQSKIRLTYSSKTKCIVPHRPFRPELDIVYIAVSRGRDPDGLPSLYMIPDLWDSELAKQVQHVVITPEDASLRRMWAQVANALRYLPKLRTIHVAFTPSSEVEGRARHLTLQPADNKTLGKEDIGRGRCPHICAKELLKDILETRRRYLSTTDVQTVRMLLDGTSTLTSGIITQAPWPVGTPHWDKTRGWSKRSRPSKKVN
ncbi:hypothetical protein F5Y06DRAFT_291298 [Hypoxylon sp. FL0890]|nr:hypothetical protein F5Y06DRAFT_291298 [Hypoxylon sp. FL0890]